jgi:hypothetical protein
MVKTLHYRLAQFVQALTASVPEEEMELVIRIMTPEAREFFRCQAIQDQHHALAVYHTLRQEGHTDPSLLTAALLHDVGKTVARLPTWLRSIIVLLEWFAPRLLARLGQPRDTQRLSSRWRRPFVIHAHHPEIGACCAQEAGCSPLTVALIRRHQEKLAPNAPCGEENRLLAALRAADNLN